MAEKVTVMELTVDLQCPRCYKKVMKILNKFPQVRDRTYKEEENRVTITVVSSDPEKVRKKLCSKGSNVIKNIEILQVEPDDESESDSEVHEEEEEEAPAAVMVGAAAGYHPLRMWCSGVPLYHHLPPPPSSYCSCGCGGGGGGAYGQYYCCYYKQETDPPSYCSII